MPYESVISDAIKILGPAIIASYVAYRVAKIQLVQKIKEIRLSQDFDARKMLFDLLVKKLDAIKENHDKLSNALGSVMGNLAATEDIAKDSFKEVFKVHRDLIRYTAEDMFNSLLATKTEMEDKELTDKKPYKELPSCIETVNNIQCTEDLESIRLNIFTLMKASSCLKKCTELLIEKEKETLLKKYLHDSK